MTTDAQRKAIAKYQSEKARVNIWMTPEGKEKLAEYIEKSEGLVEMQMNVRYPIDSHGRDANSRKATIIDSEISEDMNIDIENDLKNAYEEVYAYKQDIWSLQQESSNNVVYYEHFLKRRKDVNE